MISHIACLLIGALGGMFVIALLAAPRIAELEDTIAVMRELLKPDVTLISKVREMDTEVEG
jgi:hypothetical protein